MQCKEWDDANSELFKESHDEAVHKNSYKSRLYELISASLDRSHTKKTEKPIRGSIQVSSTNESGVCALALPFAWVLLRSWTVGKLKGKPFYVQTKGQLFPTCVSYAGYAHQREESPASLFLIAFLSSVLGLAFSSVFYRPILEEGRIEKWNSLMFPHSPVILLTADMEDGRLEIGFIIS